MRGGLLKSASVLAIVAAAGLFGSSPAKAADLGGDCCADLEERVAELEATTVRKGNRKIKLTISGFVSYNMMFWDDGTQKDLYFGDNGAGSSRWRFTGTAKISPQITAGFLYEFQASTNSVAASNQLNNGADLGGSGPTGTTGCGIENPRSNSQGCLSIRDSTVWMRHAQLGMVKIGHGSTATDNLTLIDLGGTGNAGSSDLGLFNAGMILRSKAGLLANAVNINWGFAIRGHEAFDTNRRNHVLYETPVLLGFTLQAAVAEDNYWDVALRYAGEIAGFRLAAGIGYQEDTNFNAASQLLVQNGALCATNCDVKISEVKGSASVLHTATGLFGTVAAGRREIEGTFDGNPANRYLGPDVTLFYAAAGLSKNYFGPGKTVLFGEYSESKGGLEEQAFLGTILAANYSRNTGSAANPVTSSRVTHWGVGAIQTIDAAAMDVYITYKHYSLEANGFLGGNVTLNTGSSGVNDFQQILVGTRISF